MIKAILLDFNGVVINDEPVQMRAYTEVLKADGIELTEDDYFSSLGMDDRTFVVAAFERAGKKVDEARVSEIVAEKSAKWKEMVTSEMPLFDGIKDFVEKMAVEFELGIVSMARRHEIEYVLETCGMRHHFSTIVSSDDVVKCKPDPECFRIGFRQIDRIRTDQGHLPMTHKECLVIEDSPPGVVAARNADLPVLGVTNTVSADALRNAGASAVAKDLRDWMPASVRRVFV
ncbi:MAG TPA: HAD family phosphatase [Pyrinomonadaceae bacterium]|nr:HAD family phosphatase [Chloracidobacterium sp.]MBP9934390.1 HAD family phosphatase [Pyrinomonadaceae bacterium]MBK7802631.1 HAD family phosphatase [Chloracidobacterium sp.]MBK9437481.1 HAD family phosphatase [Chloracidobacterium sp.]MBL0240151.1 HAD family phosphatase [Chloracidobacterium sp.]